jgi:hypothetical protein
MPVADLTLQPGGGKQRIVSLSRGRASAIVDGEGPRIARNPAQF